MRNGILDLMCETGFLMRCAAMIQIIFTPFFLISPHCFSQIIPAQGGYIKEDSRNGGNTRHHFGEILFIAYGAALWGVRSHEHMEEFSALHEDCLRK